jgi:hypothetical protein
MRQLPTPPIAFLDIETAPCLGWVWQKWEADVIEFKAQWYILSFAVKWFGEKKVRTYALPDYPLFAEDPENDRELVQELWSVLDRAEVVVAHNGDKFDVRKSNARFIFHGLNPPTPFKTIDTLKIARRHFNFTSNKLDDLGQYLGVGRKIPNTGKHLWLGCMRGDEKSWRAMRKYNSQDVTLLEKIYLKLRPWATNHPNLEIYVRGQICPMCLSPQLHQRGYSLTRTGKRARFQCQACGTWSKGTEHIREAVR